MRLPVSWAECPVCEDEVLFPDRPDADSGGVFDGDYFFCVGVPSHMGWASILQEGGDVELVVDKEEDSSAD